MTAVQLKIIERAIQIRLNNREELEVILNSYTKLSDSEKEAFAEKFAQ